MAEEVLYKPSDWQSRFHALQHDEALGAGSVGPGKTACLIQEPMTQIRVEHARLTGDPDSVAERGHWLHKLVDQHRIRPGGSVGRVLYMRRTMPNLEQTIERCSRIFPRIDPGCRFHQDKNGRKMFVFSSGFKYQFGHCKDIGDWENYYSDEYTMILWDELITFDHVQYEQVNSRKRTTDPILRYLMKVRAMSNPVQKLDAGARVRNPVWVREYFVDPAPEGNVTIRKKLQHAGDNIGYHTRIYLPAKLDDNPDKDFVAYYKRVLYSMPAHIRQALIDGNWYVTEGSYYAEVWSANLHTCKPFRIPDGWKRFRAMDWGLKSQGVVLWCAMDPDGNVFVEKELNFRMKKVDQVALMIREVEQSLGLWRGRKSLITGPADTQLWEERGDVGMTKAATMAKMGVRWVKAQKNRATNAQRLWDRLADHNHGTTTPGIVFFTTCKQCIKTLPGIPADPNNPEVPMDGGPDHWLDTVFYACAFASRGRAGIPSHENKGRDDDDLSPLDAGSADRGRSGYGI